MHESGTERWPAAAATEGQTKDPSWLAGASGDLCYARETGAHCRGAEKLRLPVRLKETHPVGLVRYIEAFVVGRKAVF